MASFTLPRHHGKGAQSEKLRRELVKNKGFDAVAGIFRQLGDPTRVRIFWFLCHQEECVVNLSELLGMSAPALSHHLTSMYACGLLESRREGKEVYYRAADSEECRLLHSITEQIMEIGCPAAGPDVQGTPEEIARGVHQYLTEHMAEKITIEELARKFLINPTTLKTAFKKVYGNSLAAHMKEHRMEAAAALLSDGRKNVAEVAREVGYGSQSRFSAAFREASGMLPTEYRKERLKRE